MGRITSVGWAVWNKFTKINAIEYSGMSIRADVIKTKVLNMEENKSDTNTAFATQKN